MSEEIRRELLSDLKELKRLEEENEQYGGQGINFPGGSAISYGSPQGYLRSNQVINYGNAPNFSYSQFLSPPQGRVVSNVSSYVTSQNTVGGLISSVLPLAQNYPAQQMLAYSQIPESQMNSSNVQISQNQVSGLKESIKGETYYEYVPFEKVYYEEEEKTVKELVNVKKNRTDYYAIEKKVPNNFLSFFLISQRLNISLIPNMRPFKNKFHKKELNTLLKK